MLDFVLVSWSEPRSFENAHERCQKAHKSFKINGFIRSASDDNPRAKMAKSEFLSRVRLPFRRSGQQSDDSDIRPPQKPTIQSAEALAKEKAPR